MDLPLCTECGACCVCEHGSAWYVELTREEVRQGRFSSANTLTQTFAADTVVGLRTKWVGPRCVCTHLQGETLVSVHCAIYNERPDACRQFRRGGPGCKAVLARAGVAQR